MTNSSRLINVVALVEAATGLALLTAPSLVTKLLLDANSVGVAPTICRITGVALVALAVVCLQHKVTGPSSHNGTLTGLFIYNLFVAIILANVGLSGGGAGLLLWPATIIHFLFAALLIYVPRIDRTEGVTST